MQDDFNIFKVLAMSLLLFSESPIQISFTPSFFMCFSNAFDLFNNLSDVSKNDLALNPDQFALSRLSFILLNSILLPINKIFF